jgi:dephospho-CoA kinase
MPSQRQVPPCGRLVIGIAGRIGVGKTSAAKRLTARFGFQYLRYSQILAAWMAADPESKTQLQEVGWKVMAGGMQAQLNQRLLARINAGVDAVVDGLRHPIDYETIANTYVDCFHLIFIESTRVNRWERLKSGGRYQDLAAFEAAELHPVEQQIGSLREKAALVLSNNGSLNDLYSALDDAIQNFRMEKKK